MNEPEVILSIGTRIRTSDPLGSTAGFLISQRHLQQRKPGVIGAICGIVGGHGGDVYWVAHLGDTAMAAYGWAEFELEPVKDPCSTCKGSGVDWKESHTQTLCIACPDCGGSAERTLTKPTAWERLGQEP